MSLLEAGTAPGALAGLKVLDLTGPGGNDRGKMCADLGADVILVEMPGGSGLRREGPFINDVAHIEASLPFAYANTNKRGITLDIDRPEGQEALRRLA